MRTCVCKYIHTHRRIGSLGTQIQTYVHLFVHTFRQKLNTYICILYIYTHTYTNLRMNERRRYAYIRSFIHTYIQAKLYFACASMVAIFLFYFVTFSMFTCGRIDEFIYAFVYQIVVNLERQRNCTHLCIFTQYKIGNDMCLEIPNVAQTHTYTRLSVSMCVCHVCMYVHTCKRAYNALVFICMFVCMKT